MKRIVISCFLIMALCAGGIALAQTGYLQPRVTAAYSSIIAALGFTPAHSGANSDITSLSGLTTTLPVTEGGTGSGTASGGLSNLGGAPLTSPAFITDIHASSAGGASLGTALLPFSNIFLSGASGTPATNQFKITGTSTGGARTLTLADGNMTLVSGTEATTGANTFTGNQDIGAYAVSSEITNCASACGHGGTGTVVNKIAVLTSAAPSTATLAATTDTVGAIGIVVSGAGTTGNAVIARQGQASCVFDGATTAGDYVQMSTNIAGCCMDAGATVPTLGQVLGRVLSTNASGGTYGMTLAPPHYGVPVASTTTPSMDGAASYGSGTTWARADHIHPTDTSRASSTSPQITGAAAITSFAGTVSSSSTTVTFSSAADAVLAGYAASNPNLGFTVIAGGTTAYILSWTNSTQCVVNAAPSWSSTAITSVQAPITARSNSSGVLEMAEVADGHMYFAGNVGIGTLGSGYKLEVDQPSGGLITKFDAGTTSAYVDFGSSTGAGPFNNAVGFGFYDDTRASRRGFVNYNLFSDQLQIRVNSVDYAAVINSSGNLGIGDNTPSSKLSVQSSTVLGTESCAYPSTFSNTVWTLAGDFAVNVSAATFTKSSGAGTITQTAANQAQVSAGNRLYQIQYIVSATPTVVGATMTLTTGFASSSTTLPIVAGTNTILFRSATAPANIVLSVSGATSGAFTLTSVSVKEVQGGSIALGADIKLGPTLMPAGTTGNVTINKSSGQVRIAAAGTTVTVTNNIVTANSIIMAMVASNDTTAQVKNVVPTAGSFTINMVAGVTAETPISFVIFN